MSMTIQSTVKKIGQPFCFFSFWFCGIEHSKKNNRLSEFLTVEIYTIFNIHNPNFRPNLKLLLGIKSWVNIVCIYTLFMYTRYIDTPICVEKHYVVIYVINVYVITVWEFYDSIIDGVFMRERHQTYLSLFYVEIKMLDSENCIKAVYLVVKRIERLTKKIMFLNLLTIFISRILYIIISRR